MTLAAPIGVAVWNLNRYVRRLVADRWLCVESRGRRRASMYRICYEDTGHLDRCRVVKWPASVIERITLSVIESVNTQCN